MNKTDLTEDSAFDFQAFFETENFAANPLATVDDSVLTREAPATKEFLAETILKAIKWTFLYVPGTAAIHFMTVGFALTFFYRDWFLELFLGIGGIFAVATFMIMFGIGKTLELKYLKVVLSVFMTSMLLGILYFVLASLMPGDFFGLFIKATFALPVLTGYFVKRHLDAEQAD